MKKMSLGRIWNLATVNEWYYLQETELEYRKPLQNAIELGTWVAQNPYAYFFDSIWLPVKEVTSSGIAEQFTYVNIGLTPEQLAQIYKTYHGFNYLSPAFYKDNPSLSILDLGEKIRSIFLLNKGKYLKLLELQGYTYNPLFNVDGTEIRQSLDNEGTNDVSSNAFASGHGGTAEDVTNTHKVSAYDNTEKTEYTDETKGGQNSLDGIPQYGYDSTTHQWTSGTGSLSNLSGETMSASGSRNETTYTHNNAMNKKLNETTHEYDDEEYEVDAKDTAFGQKLVGGDKMHNEKLIRQGNIGTTKTQELIDAERQNLRYSVVKEFFDDINAQILVGIY